MSITGRVAYTSVTYGLALITPLGKSRDYDILAREIWFLVGGVGEPHAGMIVEFEVGRTPEGDLEAMFIRNPRLQPPAGIKSVETPRPAGADAGVGGLQYPNAGATSEVL